MHTPFAAHRDDYDLHEFFADEFACALLMPPSDERTLTRRSPMNTARTRKEEQE